MFDAGHRTVASRSGSMALAGERFGRNHGCRGRGSGRGDAQLHRVLGEQRGTGGRNAGVQYWPVSGSVHVADAGEERRARPARRSHHRRRHQGPSPYRVPETLLVFGKLSVVHGRGVARLSDTFMGSQIFLLDNQDEGRSTAAVDSWKEDMQWARRLDQGWDLGKVKQVWLTAAGANSTSVASSGSVYCMVVILKDPSWGATSASSRLR